MPSFLSLVLSPSEHRSHHRACRHQHLSASRSDEVEATVLAVVVYLAAGGNEILLAIDGYGVAGNGHDASGHFLAASAEDYGIARNAVDQIKARSTAKIRKLAEKLERGL